mgnify:CR=1 FL=1
MIVTGKRWVAGFLFGLEIKGLPIRPGMLFQASIPMRHGKTHDTLVRVVEVRSVGDGWEIVAYSDNELERYVRRDDGWVVSVWRDGWEPEPITHYQVPPQWFLVDDPGTRAGLLEILREKAGDPGAYVALHPDDSATGLWRAESTLGMAYASGATEFEALTEWLMELSD